MKFLRLFILFCLLLIAVSVWGVALFETTYSDRVYAGVSAMGLDLGGLTRAEARTALHERLAQAQTAQLLYFRDGAQRYALTLSELGIRLDEEVLLNAAFAIGRHGDWSENLREQLDALLNGRSVTAAEIVDEGAAQVALKRLSRQVDRAPRDASLLLIGLQVMSEPAVVGRTLDVAETIERLKSQLRTPDPATRGAHSARRGHTTQPPDELELVVRDVAPVVRDASGAAEQIRAILAAPLRLMLSEQTWIEVGKAAPGLLLAPVQQERVWTLDSTMLASMVSTRQVQGGDGIVKLSVTLDDEKLMAFLNEIATQIERKPRDARFYFDEKTQKLTPLVASQDGRALDVAASLQRIKQQIASENRTIQLVVQTIKPTIALEDADKFNIKELVVAGTTSFKGSSAERVQNISVAMNQFHGVVVAPGQEFSFNQYLGDVVDAKGYEQSYVIVGDQTAVGIGGGVCQVSTTAFRAAFFGGYQITQRWAHGYTVGYYEPPVGLDATVFAPQVDFRFVNDTPNYLLIQPSIDLKASTLTYKFFGTKNNRVVELEGPIISNIIKHGPDIRENDPTLPVGVVKQIDFAHDGKTVVVNRIVKEGDKVLRRDRFVSNYRPWQARFLVGTKKSAT